MSLVPADDFFCVDIQLHLYILVFECFTFLLQHCPLKFTLRPNDRTLPNRKQGCETSLEWETRAEAQLAGHAVESTTSLCAGGRRSGDASTVVGPAVS